MPYIRAFITVVLTTVPSKLQRFVQFILNASPKMSTAGKLQATAEVRTKIIGIYFSLAVFGSPAVHMTYKKIYCGRILN